MRIHLRGLGPDIKIERGKETTAEHFLSEPDPPLQRLDPPLSCGDSVGHTSDTRCAQPHPSRETKEIIVSEPEPEVVSHHDNEVNFRCVKYSREYVRLAKLSVLRMPGRAESYEFHEYRIHPCISRTQVKTHPKFCFDFLVSGSHEKYSNLIPMCKTHPYQLYSILEQKCASYTRVDTVMQQGQSSAIALQHRRTKVRAEPLRMPQHSASL